MHNNHMEIISITTLYFKKNIFSIFIPYIVKKIQCLRIESKILNIHFTHTF